MTGPARDPDAPPAPDALLSDDERAILHCASEPIRIPGSIQPQGALLVLDPASWTVLQAAIGPQAPIIAKDPVGHTLTQLLPGGERLKTRLSQLPERGTVHLGAFGGVDDRHDCIAHRAEGGIILEFEPVGVGEETFGDLHPHVRELLDAVQGATTIDALAALAAREVRRLTGLDRVLVYRFDEAWNGTVLAEDRNDRLPSYLGLRFPASDIPAQARELYRANRLRLIADADYEPVAIEPALNPVTGQPIDLSHAVLRSVSPVHLRYMRNMGTMASMSISLMRGDSLWGLISCHHRDPARIGYPARMACDLVGQILSLQIAAKEASALSDRRAELQDVQRRLLARMASADHFIDGLVDASADLLALTGASGAAVVAAGGCMLLGETPEEADVRALVRWLVQGERDDQFVSDCLSDRYEGGAAIKDHASGVLAISFSQLHGSYVLWFRPEVIRTISWGGDPRKRAELAPEGLRLNPRTSFEAWQETVRQRAEPWHAAEIEAAAHLRSAIVDIVLGKAEELAALSERLVAINRELEAFSYSVSHDLRAPFRHIVGYAQLLRKLEGGKLSATGSRYVDTIVESAVSAGTLVDDLLKFSQMGRATLAPIRIDMNALVVEVRRGLIREGSEDRIEWRIASLPPATADPVMVRLALQNLIDNAIKFSRDRLPAVIEIGSVPCGDEQAYFVRDNGVGFDMAYVGKLFGVFQRLHRVEEFEGTGIGLANVKRIVDRHGGRVWAEGALGKGATIFFTLPHGEP